MTLSLTGAGTLGGGGPRSGTGGIVTFPAVTITGVGQSTLTATSSFGSASVSVSTQPFTVFAGDLECFPTPPFHFSGSVPPNVADPITGIVSGGLSITEPGYAEGRRGGWNKDGSGCNAVAYTFTNDILSSDPTKKNSATLRWDTGAQPNAAFAYTLTFIDEPVDSGFGIPTSRTKVAWEFNPDGSPKYVVYAVACVSPQLPEPYGTLAAGLTASVSDTTITINGPALPTGVGVSFPIAIGPAPSGSNAIERMQATWQSGTATSSTYTVQRMQGGTPLASHPAGAQVMSTPLPIDPNPYLPTPLYPPNTVNPYAGKQANMCIADEGWVSVGGGPVRFTTTIFDVGDGAVSRDF